MGETFYIAMAFLQPDHPYYDTQGNRHCEQYNWIIWQVVTFTLKAQCLAMMYWEYVLEDTLHLICTLLLTATNTTPQEWLFNFQCQLTIGCSLLIQLSCPGAVLLRCHVRQSKYSPVVEEAESPRGKSFLLIFVLVMARKQQCHAEI